MTTTDVSWDFSGKVVIVTGGTRGIGAAIATSFLAAGAEVAVCGRSAPEALPEAGGRKARFFACDVRDAAACGEFVDAVGAAFGRVDILINNAGGSPDAAAATVSPRFTEAIVALNLTGPIHMSQAAHRWISQTDGGSILNIASVSAVRPSPGTAAYGAAKAGLLGLTRSLAQEWGPSVRVNALVVGMIATEHAEDTYGAGAAQAEIAKSVAMQRLGTGQDIANAALFMASSAAGFVSGAALEVHGGDERPLYRDILDRHADAPD
jgi:NAD(P)-dependent dehydrogenase (short-subunit alcohol dehydrogenase family)